MNARISRWILSVALLQLLGPVGMAQEGAGESELRPLRNLRLTLGLRFESQPPAVDSQDRIAAFRVDGQSVRFPDTLPNLIFPGQVFAVPAG